MVTKEQLFEKLDSLSLETKTILQKYQLNNYQQGRLDAHIYHLVDSSNQKGMFIKLTVGHASLEIDTEQKIIKALSGLFPVPKLIDYVKTESNSVLLTEEIEGSPAHILSDRETVDETIYVVGKALKQLHNLSSKVDLKLNGLDEEFQNIDTALKDNLINVVKFQTQNKGQSPIAAFKQLSIEKQSHLNNVLTHGDYCLPNILRIDANLSGVIDWGKAGMGDPHRDFAAMEGSILRNFGDRALDIFYEAYGITKQDIDRNKILFYERIDQFWYCMDE